MSPVLLRDALWRQLALALASMLVLLLLVVLGVYELLRAFEQSSWQDRQHEAAESAAQTVEAYVEQATEAIRFAGVLDGGFLAEHPAALADLLRQNERLLELVRVDAAGDLLAAAAADGEAPVLAEQFTIPESSWFHAAAAGQRFLGGLQLSSRAQPSLILALPAMDGGAVAARIQTAGLWAAVDAFRFGEGGRAYVVDADGRLVAHSDPEVVLARAGLEGRPELSALRGAPEGRWSGTYANFEGREVVAATAPVAEGEWFVFAELPRAEAFAWSRLAWTWLSGATALLGILTLAMAGWLLAQLLWPLRLAPAAGLLPPAPMGASAASAEALEHTRPLSRSDVEALRAAFDDMYHRVTDIDRLTSEFLATISHELRTPLNSVIGYAELILSGVNGPLDAEMEKDVRAIFENGHQLLRLVNDLLDLAKIEAGRLELELVQLDPLALLAEAREANRLQVSHKGLELQLDELPELPWIWGDPVRLRQVLDNLISNAVKFTEQGWVRLGARQEGDWLVLSVADSGIGISEADRETIFERFRQLDGSFTRRAEGTGLGLAISRHLVRMHGGRITVDSVEGRGSTFAVWLPIEDSPSHSRGLAIGSLL